VLGTRPTGPAGLPPNTQFTVERYQHTEPSGYLPELSDGSFDDYQQRVTDRLGGRRYALVVHGFHGFSYPQWTRQCAFYANLWERVGLPSGSAITTMFHGTYEHSPVGVHKDRFATFMFGLKGRKRMRFWPRRPWSEPVTTILDYEPYLAESFAIEVAAGDLLYWPSSYFHVGESAGDEPATSVNVGVPREGHRAAHDLDDLLVDIEPSMVIDPSLSATLLAGARAPLSTMEQSVDGWLPASPPPALMEAVAILQDRTSGHRLTDLITERSLRYWTAGGFRPVPPRKRPRPLTDDTVLRACAPILSDRVDGGALCAANGHAVRTTLPKKTLSVLLERLRTNQAVRVADVSPSDRAATRTLLEDLESARAVTRVDTVPDFARCPIRTT